MEYLFVKWLHIQSSTVLFGTGIGSAFYMLFVSLPRDVRATAVVSRYVVRADWCFTTPTVILQPVTGAYMFGVLKLPWSTAWIAQSLAWYGLAIACWLPVVWIQIRMRELAGSADRDGKELPPAYWRFLSAWVALGIPAFIAFLIVFYLMVAKPV